MTLPGRPGEADLAAGGTVVLRRAHTLGEGDGLGDAGAQLADRLLGVGVLGRRLPRQPRGRVLHVIAGALDLIDEAVHVGRQAAGQQHAHVELLRRRVLLGLVEPGLEEFLRELMHCEMTSEYMRCFRDALGAKRVDRFAAHSSADKLLAHQVTVAVGAGEVELDGEVVEVAVAAGLARFPAPITHYEPAAGDEYCREIRFDAISQTTGASDRLWKVADIVMPVEDAEAKCTRPS